MDQLSTIILAVALIIVMLGMGLSLVIDDFKRILVHPRAIFTGLTNQIIILPILGFLIASILKLDPEIAVGIMILAACPGGPTSNLISYLAKGDVALSVTLTAISSIVTIFTIPFIVNWSLIEFMEEGKIIQLDVIDTITKIMVIVLVPVAIGMLVRRYKTAFAEKMARPVRIASGLVLALVIIGIVLKEKDNFVSYFQQAGIAAFLLNALTMVIGYYSARIMKVNNRQATAISIESGIQNGTLAITVATIMLSSTSLAIAPAVYSLIMFGTGGIAIYLGVNRLNKEIRQE